MGRYREALVEAMTELAAVPGALFLGQAVAVPGTAMFGTLEGVPLDKRLELPVEEDFQLGMSIGLAMQGFLPISIFPRWNFLILAANQLVNHLNVLGEMTRSLPPKVIIRTSVGSERPLNPGPQHTGDLTRAFSSLLGNIAVVRLNEATEIRPAYRRAVARTDGVSTILVEWGDYLTEK